MQNAVAAGVAMLLVCGCGPGAKPGDGDGVQPSTPDAHGGDVLDGNPGPDGPACATATYQAQQTPAALLVVLDRSSSMAQSNKWVFSAQAIVAALDQDAFDSVYVGLYAAPTGSVAGPDCIFGLPVACQAPPFPQIDLQLSGSLKSSAPSGVRHDIKAWLTANAPDSGLGDASPLYAGLQAAIGALQLWPVDGKRIVLVITDGSLSCNEFSSRPGFGDCNGCTHDWEDPSSLVTLLATAHADPNKPVETFLIGVPGADTFDPSACDYPPYHMRLALSAIAYAGAPGFAPAGCTGTSFSQGGGDPAMSCHFDMTQGGFSSSAIADTIAQIRGQTQGCQFDLPEPPPGSSIDLDEVNVNLTVDGVTVPLSRRADPSNQCLAGGCWDYTADGHLELIGEACTDLQGGASTNVEIVVGCQTVVQ